MNELSTSQQFQEWFSGWPIKAALGAAGMGLAWLIFNELRRAAHAPSEKPRVRHDGYVPFVHDYADPGTRPDVRVRFEIYPYTGKCWAYVIHEGAEIFDWPFNSEAEAMKVLSDIGRAFGIGGGLKVQRVEVEKRDPGEVFGREKVSEV